MSGVVECGDVGSERDESKGSVQSQKNESAVGSSKCDPIALLRLAVPSDVFLKTSIPFIGTHDGTFHCDEALACVMLKILPEFKDALVVRSRSPDVLAKCSVVVDVGGIYNHDSKRYDHHQRTFDVTMSTICPEIQSDIKLSSAGLVYAHYGKEIIKEVLGANSEQEIVDVVWKKVYEGFICEIDAIDNGITQTDEPPRYKFVTNISNRVASLNVPWNNPLLNESTQFLAACELVQKEFIETVQYYGTTWWPARSIVKSALLNRNLDTVAASQVIVLPQFCPWIGHLLELEKELCTSPLVKFALFNDRDGSWRVRAVPENATSFILRNPLKEEWRGIRDEQLSVLAGIPDCMFVHSTGFIGANKTQDGAMQMAFKSLLVSDL